MQEFVRDESGASAVEYAFIIVATAVALIAVRPQINERLRDLLHSVTAQWL